MIALNESPCLKPILISCCKSLVHSIEFQLSSDISNRIERKLFSSLKAGKHVSSDSSIIRLVDEGHHREAMDAFCHMHNSGMKPTKFVLCSILTSCCKVPHTCLGVQVHAHILEVGYGENLFLGSKLVDLYSKSGTVQDAKKVFDGMVLRDLVLWTSIISGFSQNGCGVEALIMFKKMLDDGVRPNTFTLASVINGCKGFSAGSKQGRMLHAHILKLGFETNAYVNSALIDLYAKFGEISEAKSVFELISEKDSIIYNSMISGYSQNMLGQDSLKLFVKMQQREIAATTTTFSSLLNSCGTMPSLVMGKQLHSLVHKLGIDRNVFVSSTLLDMYSKCGSIDEAVIVFESSGTERNNIHWTSMIVGYAQNGRAADALKLFKRFIEDARKPDSICFIGVLTACNHSGLLEEGLHYFNLMTSKYGLVPDLDHYACMIDLYGRMGHLRAAKNLMMTMAFKPNMIILSSFLGFCRHYGKGDLAMEAISQLFEMEPNNAEPYILLADNYVKAGFWEEAAEVRKVMKSRGIRKSAGWSCIELGTKVHVFTVCDVSHPWTYEIYSELEKLMLEVRYVGHISLSDFGFSGCDLS